MDKIDYFAMSRLLKILNITEGTIRNYEKKGLIIPQKQDGNHYRKFGYRDVNRIASIRKYRSWDMPLCDIKGLLGSETPEDSQNILLKHQKLLKDEVSRLHDTIQKIDEDIDKISRVKKYLNTFSIVTRPDFVFYTLSDILENKQIVSDHLFDGYASIIDKNQFFGIIKPEFGCVHQGLHGPAETGTPYPACSCLYTVIKVEPFHTGVVSFSQVLEPSKRYVQSHHYTVSDDILGIKLLTLQEEGQQRDYYEIYIPVQV